MRYTPPACPIHPSTISLSVDGHIDWLMDRWAGGGRMLSGQTEGRRRMGRRRRQNHGLAEARNDGRIEAAIHVETREMSPVAVARHTRPPVHVHCRPCFAFSSPAQICRSVKHPRVSDSHTTVCKHDGEGCRRRLSRQIRCSRPQFCRS